MKQYDALTLRGDRTALEILSAVGESLPITGLVDDDSSITFFFQPGVLDDAVERELRGFLPEGTQVTMERSSVEEQNWNAEFEASLEPVRIGEHLTITQSWNPVEPASAEDLVVTIDPKMSFGTGHHESTRLIARLLERVPLERRRLLDVGTGTGVLAIVAALRGAAYVEAFDNNEWAVENARENLRLNGSPSVTLFEGEIDQVNGRDFDLILENIHRNVILELLPRTIELLSDRPGSSLLTSGVLFEDHESLVEAARQVGLEVVDTEREHEWIATRFERVERTGR